MGFFWSSTPSPVAVESLPVVEKNETSCPVNYKSSWLSNSQPTPPPGHPIVEGSATCPVIHQSSNDKLNPLTNMPDLPSTPLPNQKVILPTERTTSSIPRGDAGNWEYPSPQQMFNAMIRKNSLHPDSPPIPEDAVESMVNIHNFLNEAAWDEIKEWEEPYTKQTGVEPRLLKFTGRPGDWTPRGQMMAFLSKWSENFEEPFDRHDWTVLRGEQHVRYVIDYYEAGEEHGMPMFSLDVRPALDDWESACQRWKHWIGEMKPVWDKALGKESRSDDRD